MTEGRYLNFFSIVIGWVVIGFIFVGLIIAILIDADTVSFWAFYDTLQLLTHLPLANISMPG